MAAIELPDLRQTPSSRAERQTELRDQEAIQPDLRVQDEQELQQQQLFTLPPADSGIRAWLFLAGCFITEALVWGMLVPSRFISFLYFVVVYLVLASSDARIVSI